MTRTVEDYAAAVASGEPTPGGGSVIATVAAFAAGLAEMVCHLTLARPVDPSVAAALTDAATAAARLRRRFLDAAGEDELAYAAYRNATVLPKATPDERAARKDAIESALETSAAVPLDVAGRCVDLLSTLDTVATFGSRHAIADVQTSLRLTGAALKGALDMVAANTGLMRNRETAADLDRQARERMARGEKIEASIVRALAARSA